MEVDEARLVAEALVAFVPAPPLPALLQQQQEQQQQARAPPPLVPDASGAWEVLIAWLAPADDRLSTLDPLRASCRRLRDVIDGGYIDVLSVSCYQGSSGCEPDQLTATAR
jgi:hypothetical protein